MESGRQDRCRPRRAPGRIARRSGRRRSDGPCAPHARREGTPLCERSVGRSPRTALAAHDARAERAGRIARRNGRRENVPRAGPAVRCPRPGLPANGPFRRHRARPTRRSMDRIERKHPVQVRLVASGRYRVLAPHRADARQRTDRLCRRTGRYGAPGSGARVRQVKANAGVRQNRRGSAAGQKERDSRERAAVVRRRT